MDCSKWERDAFSECIMAKAIPTVGHCISTSIIYKNNTPYRIVKSEDGFFCISKDNFPERNWFLEQGIIKSEGAFEKVWQRNRHYSWRIFHPPPFIKFGKMDVYKYGDPLWIFINSTNTVNQMVYPAPLASSVCGQNKVIRYLQNFESQCLENIPMSEAQCLSYGLYHSGKYYLGQVLIASPSLINSTYNFNEVPDEALITIKYMLCEDNVCNEVDSLPTPEFDSLTYVCKNLITSVDLEIKHNGSQGIIQARYRVGLSSTDPHELLFQRKFNVEFLPAHQSNTSVIFKRSGTPGYRIGLPVITGSLQDGKVVKKKYLTMISGPNCSQSTNIMFGENSRTQCILQIPLESTRNCTRLSEEIAKLLSMERNGNMIGASGDPDTWLKRPVPVPVNLWHTATQEPCSISTSLLTDFLYSYSGSLWQPEANIIGVSSRLGGQRFIDCSTSLFFCNIRLLSIVSFTDVSQPAVNKFATPPVVKIKLPQDFFYPFSSSSCLSMFNRISLMYFFISVSLVIAAN
nr:tectonic-1-like [Halyomorpha halys]